MDDGDAIGLLGIELYTRRRNRLNGTIMRTERRRLRRGGGRELWQLPDATSMCATPSLRVTRICRTPETARAISDRLDDSCTPHDRRGGHVLRCLLCRSTKTARVASMSLTAAEGRALFTSAEDGVLTIPDYAGNMFFNTLGNLLANPKAGLVFAGLRYGRSAATLR